MHTPRPWTWEWKGQSVVVHSTPCDSIPLGSRVCIVPHTMFNDADEVGPLIAAAPDLEDVCVKVSSRPAEVRAIMQREGIVIDNLDDPMQKFAFTLYTMLVQDAEDAERVIAKVKGESND